MAGGEDVERLNPVSVLFFVYISFEIIIDL